MSNKFYTFVGMMDNAIYHRYYDENAKEVFEKVEEYDYSLYVEHRSEKSGYKSLYGKDLKEFNFNNPYDLSKFYRENKDMVTIHGNDNAVSQFISKEYQYDVQQTCEVNILNFDLEVEHSQGFPDPQKGEQEIMSVSLKKFGKDEPMYSIGTKPLLEYDNPHGVYIQCKDEKEVLVQFMKIWREINPQIITGWNIDSFDIPYLVNRIKNVFGEKALAYLSPFKDKVKNNNKLITEKVVNKKFQYDIFGITSYDYIDLYKKYNPDKQESYKLDHVGDVELDQRKVNFDEYRKSLMNLYNGVITVDLKTPFAELDTIMKYARVREVVRRRLEQVGFSIENGDKYILDENNLYRFDLETFDFKIIKDADNETLKGLYSFCDERVKTLSYKKFVMYNEQDANLVELLDRKKNFMRLAIRVGHMSKSKLQDIFGTVAPWDNMIYSRLLAKKIQIPPRQSHDKDEKFPGAYVKDPVLGFHKWVATVDLKSLYPSIIRMLNMSPETLRKSKAENSFSALRSVLNRDYDLYNEKSKGWATAANGTAFTQEFEGVLPEAMKYLMEQRDIVKTEMKDTNNYLQHIIKYIESCEAGNPKLERTEDYEKSYKRHSDKFMTDEEIKDYGLEKLNKLTKQLYSQVSMLDATQLALKILANSGYGAIGNVGFRYFRLEIAEGITLTGQMAIKFMSKVLDDFLNEVCGTKDEIYAIYGDTDSIFISLDKWVKKQGLDETNVDSVITAMDNYMAKTIEPLIAENYLDISNYLGAKENLLIMKREALADATIFRGKKNYIMQLYDNEHVRFAHPKMKMMGVETAKSSTAMIVRKKLEECFRIIINKDTSDPLELKRIVDEFREEFNIVDLVSISTPKSVNDIEKWVDERGNILSGCPIHVRGAIVYNQFIQSDETLKRRYEEINSGTKIRYMYLKLPNILHSHVVAFIDDIPPEMELQDSADRKSQFEKTFMGPLESFTQLIDWDVRRTNSLNSLFEENDEEDEQQLIELEIKKEKQKQKPKKVSMDSLFD